jgi:hypothetical protein
LRHLFQLLADRGKLLGAAQTTTVGGAPFQLFIDPGQGLFDCGEAPLCGFLGHYVSSKSLSGSNTHVPPPAKTPARYP